MSEGNYFEKLSKINVNEHVEKKGKFTYLSWAYAVDVLRKEDPRATWEVIRFNGMPFMETKLGYFVEVAVTVQGITLSQIHPILDNNNRPIAQPNSFQVNTSIQRALVKAIALHGLGLYIYAGEDLPDGAEEPEPTKPKGTKPNKPQSDAELFNEAVGEPADEDLAAIEAASNAISQRSGVTLTPTIKGRYQAVFESLNGIEKYAAGFKNEKALNDELARLLHEKVQKGA